MPRWTSPKTITSLFFKNTFVMAFEKSRKVRDFSSRNAFNPTILLKTALESATLSFETLDRT